MIGVHLGGKVVYKNIRLRKNCSIARIYQVEYDLLSIVIIFLVLMLLKPMAALASQNFFAKSYALVVGIDQYEHSSDWPTIPHGEKDASAMANLLTESGYDVVKLLGMEATRENILKAISENIAPKLTGHDRVLIYFSGHGDTREVGWRDFGYIIPHDATNSFPTWISMAEVRELSQHMLKARHQLFIFDACYGGSIGMKAGKRQSDRHPRYIEKISGNRARQFIVAGGKDELVPATGPDGYSYFTGYLLRALGGEADRDQDTYVTVSELSAFLLSAASSWGHTPRWGVLPEHAQGEFWFRVPAYKQNRVPDSSSIKSAILPWIFKGNTFDEQGKMPDLLSHPQGPIDNFTVIDGIDVDVQAELYELGIFHYWQMAEWNDRDLAWLREKTILIGKIVDRSWISAAESLGG